MYGGTAADSLVAGNSLASQRRPSPRRRAVYCTSDTLRFYRRHGHTCTARRSRGSHRMGNRARLWIRVGIPSHPGVSGSLDSSSTVAVSVQYGELYWKVSSPLVLRTTLQPCGTTCACASCPDRMTSKAHLRAPTLCRSRADLAELNGGISGARRYSRGIEIP